MEQVVSGSAPKNTGIDYPVRYLTDSLATLNTVNHIGFNPEISEIDITGNDESQLSVLVNKKEIWMIFKGIGDTLQVPPRKKLNADFILKKVRCPILFVPLIWSLRDIQRLVYIADLRYCRLNVVRYIADFANFWSADVSIANLPASGLPAMEENYALGIFNEEIRNNVNYDKLLFQNINEKDLKTAIDVMINGLHNDLLVLLNHRFHFEEIIGKYIANILPAYITVPVLIFPQ
jgi:hypothetical protein